MAEGNQDWEEMGMATIQKPQSQVIQGERRDRLVRLMEGIDARAGVPAKTTVTPQELRARQVVSGIRPEDNEGSRELLRMRYGDGYSQE